MNVLCRENTHGHSQSQSNGDQRHVDALPRLIKQRVVIVPIRKMQMQSESLEDAHRAHCVYRAICYDILRLNLHTQRGHTHAYGKPRARAHTCTAGDATRRRLRGFARICMNSKSIDHTPGTILA